MKVGSVIQSVAVGALFVVMIMNVNYSLRNLSFVPLSFSLGMKILVALGGAGVWGICMWTIWMRPRTWSLGIGLFLALILSFQIFLWERALRAFPNRVVGRGCGFPPPARGCAGAGGNIISAR